MRRTPDRNPSIYFAAGLATLLITLAACSDALGLIDREPVSLSVASSPSSPDGQSGMKGLASLRVVAGSGHVLDLELADLTLADVRLERSSDGRDSDSDSDSDADSDADTDSDGRDGRRDESLHSGPTTIELPLDGGIVTLFSRPVPIGTYREIEADVEFLRLRGVYDGQPFDVTVRIDRELDIDLSPPLVVRRGDDRGNVTILIDITPCLRDATGAPIDPRRLQSEPALRDAFRSCIARALDAFEDTDHDADDRDSDSDSDW